VLPAYVALVPLDKNSSVPADELREVAAALQQQVVRHLGPIWGVAGTVSAFASLEDLPPGYLPLAVTQSPLPLHRHGFHFMMGGLPFGVVEYADDGSWTVAASHELLEMLCDPFAQRSVLGPSLADVKDAAINPQDEKTGARASKPVIEGESGYTRQGLVNYLVEVCDPCEESTYRIGDIRVSDFVTPGYYDTRGASPAPYSFLGRVTTQLGILKGGSIAWRPLLPQSLVYQATTSESEDSDKPGSPTSGSDLSEVLPENLEIRKVLDGTSGLSIGAQRSPRRPDRLGPGRDYHTTQTSWSTAGDVVRGDLEALLKHLQFLSTHQPPSTDEVIGLLEDLLKDGGGWDEFARDANVRTAVLGRIGVDSSHAEEPESLERKEYEKVLIYLREQKKVAGIFGPDLASNDLALWLCMQIG
jgi:hypothetical protein